MNTGLWIGEWGITEHTFPLLPLLLNTPECVSHLSGSSAIFSGYNFLFLIKKRSTWHYWRHLNNLNKQTLNGWINLIPHPRTLSSWVTWLGVLERSSPGSKWVLTCLWCHSLERWPHLNPSSHSDVRLLWFIVEPDTLCVFPLREVYRCQPEIHTLSAAP